MLSQHQTVDAAFAEVDRLAATMARTGAPTNAVGLVVIDVVGAMIVSRSEMH
jgi:hypothetical protein